MHTPSLVPNDCLTWCQQGIQNVTVMPGNILNCIGCLRNVQNISNCSTHRRGWGWGGPGILCSILGRVHRPGNLCLFCLHCSSLISTPPVSLKCSNNRSRYRDIETSIGPRTVIPCLQFAPPRAGLGAVGLARWGMNNEQNRA